MPSAVQNSYGMAPLTSLAAHYFPNVFYSRDFAAETKRSKTNFIFQQLKELQTRQAALLTLQRDAEMRLAEAEEEVNVLL